MLNTARLDAMLRARPTFSGPYNSAHTAATTLPWNPAVTPTRLKYGNAIHGRSTTASSSAPNPSGNAYAGNSRNAVNRSIHGPTTTDDPARAIANTTNAAAIHSGAQPLLCAITV